MPEDALDQRVIDPLVISRLVGRSEAIAQNRNVALRPRRARPPENRHAVGHRSPFVRAAADPREDMNIMRSRAFERKHGRPTHGGSRTSLGS